MKLSTRRVVEFEIRSRFKDTVAIPEFLEKSLKILKQGFISDAIMLDLSRFGCRKMLVRSFIFYESQE